VLADIAEVMVRTGETSKATTLVNTISDSYQHAAALTRLASAVAAAGDLDRAEAMVRMIDDPYHRAAALVRLVVEVRAAVDLPRAQALVDAIDSPDQQVAALIALARHVSVPDARRLVAVALRSGHWIAALGMLGSIEPDTISAIADDFLAAGRDQHALPKAEIEEA
jgi:hypothetical protein